MGSINEDILFKSLNNYLSPFYYDQTQLMQQTPIQIKTLIHHILRRHNVYRMQMGCLHQMLTLLEEPQVEQPQKIQELLFQGIIRFNRQHKDRVSSALSQHKFKQISYHVKSTIHTILHQYYFLNSIRAWEMFQPHYQHHSMQSQNQADTFPGQLLDDQYEKARVQYMYYGSVSHQHQNIPTGMLSQQPIVSGYHPSYHSVSYSRNQGCRPDRMLTKEEPLEKSSINHRKEQEKQFLEKSEGTTAPTLHNLSIKKELSEIPSDGINQNKREIKNIDTAYVNIDHCLCKGALSNSPAFQCKCKRFFHVSCLGDREHCLSCQQAQHDPFNKVLQILGSYAVDLSQEKVFQCYVNLQSHSSVLYTEGHGVIVSCAHPNHKGICWPDDIVLSINNQPVLELPSLQQTYSKHRRNDGQYSITPYLLPLGNDPSVMSQIKLTLEVKVSVDTNISPGRNNRKEPFQLCIFIVRHHTSMELFDQLIQKNVQLRPPPFNWNIFQTVVPTTLQITLFDPYSLELMQYPARGYKCKHLQCFDLKTFIIMMHSTLQRLWLCPFCGEDSRELLIDQFQLSLIAHFKTKSYIPNKIVFYVDGKIEYIFGQSDGMDSEDEEKEQ